MSRNYNPLFRSYELHCKENGLCNLFHYIEFYELEKLNFLLDRFLIFVENFEGDLEDYDCGDELNRLYNLVKDLYDRDCL